MSWYHIFSLPDITKSIFMLGLWINSKSLLHPPIWLKLTLRKSGKIHFLFTKFSFIQFIYEHIGPLYCGVPAFCIWFTEFCALQCDFAILTFSVNWKLEARSKQFFWFQVFPSQVIKNISWGWRWFSHLEQVLLSQRTQICFPAPT